MSLVDDASDRFDAFQRRHRVLGFAHAVQKRYGEDNGPWLGAVISYYTMFALLPLMLAFVTLLRIVLDDNRDRLQRILDAVWTQLPFVGADIRDGVAPVTGSAWVVVGSLFVALWGAQRAVRVAQDAMNIMWCVPRYARPGFFPKLGRTLAVYALLAVGLLGTTVITGLTLGLRLHVLAAIATGIGTVVANSLVMAGLYFLLTSRKLSWRDTAPGAALAGGAVYGLTLLGGVYVQRVVSEASSLYGSFAAFVGLLAWITLLIQAFVYGNLVNVVRVEHLWPRTFTGRNLGPPDVRAVELTTRRVQLVSEDRLDPTREPPADPA